MNKPCTKCSTAYHYGGHGYPRGTCYKECELYKKYESNLESRRKFIKGKGIYSIGEFMGYCDKNSFVFWHDKLLHIEAIRSWQFRIVERSLQGGWICAAIEKCN